MKLFAFLKSLIRKIPGFRQMSSSSIVIAATWYGAALLTMVRYWHWGLAMLALPFFVFYLIDANVMKNKALCRVVSIAAGLLVLLGAAGGLASGQAVSAPPAASVPPSPSVTAPATLSPATAIPSPAAVDTVAPSAAPAQAKTAQPSSTPDPAGCAYLASRNGGVFHRRDCPSAKKIKPENLVGFPNREDAAAAGMRPCKNCRP